MIIHRLPFVYKALSFLPLALPLFFLPQPLSASIKICQQSPAFGTCLYCVTLFKYSVDRGCISEDRTEDGQNKRSHGRKPRRSKQINDHAMAPPVQLLPHNNPCPNPQLPPLQIELDRVSRKNAGNHYIYGVRVIIAY